MEQKTSLSLISELDISNAVSVSQTHARNSDLVPDANYLGAAQSTVSEDVGAIKLQFRRVYKNLRTLVQDLLTRERRR